MFSAIYTEVYIETTDATDKKKNTKYKNNKLVFNDEVSDPYSSSALLN